MIVGSGDLKTRENFQALHVLSWNLYHLVNSHVDHLRFSTFFLHQPTINEIYTDIYNITRATRYFHYGKLLIPPIPPPPSKILKFYSMSRHFDYGSQKNKILEKYRSILSMEIEVPAHGSSGLIRCFPPQIYRIPTNIDKLVEKTSKSRLFA